MSLPRLLFLCHTLPYPPDGGVWIRSYHTLRLLARAFEVSGLCFERVKGSVRGHDASAGLNALREFGEIEAVPLPQETRKIRGVTDHLKSLLTDRVFTWYRYSSSAYRERLLRLLDSRRFDLVHVDSLDLSGYLPLMEDRTVVCAHHNIESQLLRRRAAAERWPWLRAYVGRQAELLKREERRWCPRMALNIAVSEDDRRRLVEMAPGARVEVVPNGVDTEFFRPVEGEDGGGRGLVFVGSSTWFPNRDGFEFFCAEILPALRRRRPDLEVTWVGYCSEKERAYYRRVHGVHLTGHVADIRPIVAAADCYIVPLRVGGGTRLKILDAWAMGKAVVSTSVGCEGLEATDGQNILIRDDPRAFAEAVETVLRDSGLRRCLAREGRATVERTYSWEAIGSRMERIYRSLL